MPSVTGCLSLPTRPHSSAAHLCTMQFIISPSHHSPPARLYLRVLIVVAVASARRRCTKFNGDSISCRLLDRARRFNRKKMPGLKSSSYGAVRKAITEYGLSGETDPQWDVGHACPDPNKKSSADKEDRGWNLFAQEHEDNFRLAHCLVTCAEAKHYGADHVFCTTKDGCQSCESQEYPDL